MKILHLGKYYYPFYGGMETVLKDLCEESAKRPDFQIKVICSNTKFVTEVEEINQVKIIRLSRLANIFSQPINPFLPFVLLRETFWADIIHIHSPNPIIEFLSIFLPRKKVITHHSDIINQKFLKILYLPFYILFKFFIKKIIVPTENHIKFSSMINNDFNKHSIIPFGLKEEQFHLTEPIKVKVKDLPEKFFLFVGRLVEYKGVEYLIKAMKDVDAPLYIVGTGVLKDELTELVKQEKLEEKVKVLGRVEDNIEFESYYFGCTALVLPSITPNENFGMVQLEAMKCKKPIVTTRLKSGVPVVAEENISSLLVEPRNSQELAAAMNKLLSNLPLAKEMGEAGYKRFKEKYQLNLVIDQHIKLYKSVIEELQ